MSAEDMSDYKEFPTKESALDWLDNYLSLDERNNLIRALEQEPTTKNNLGVDLISRADARKAIIDHQYSDSFCVEHNIDHSINTGMALIALSDLPPVTSQEPRWISVSERLPEEWKSVLVCYKSQGGIAQCVSERLINMDGSNRWSALGGQEPIAWMPLPKPYEPRKVRKRNKG